MMFRSFLLAAAALFVAGAASAQQMQAVPRAGVAQRRGDPRQQAALAEFDQGLVRGVCIGGDGIRRARARTGEDQGGEAAHASAFWYSR